MITGPEFEQWAKRYCVAFGIDIVRDDGSRPSLSMLRAWYESDLKAADVTMADLDAATRRVSATPPRKVEQHRAALTEALQIVLTDRRRREAAAKYRHGDQRPLTQEQIREHLARSSFYRPTAAARAKAARGKRRSVVTTNAETGELRLATVATNQEAK